MIPLPPGPYSIIYADPPWTYRAWTNNRRYGTADSHYPTMTIQDIASLPVKSIAAPNAALFLWVASPLLPDGLYVMQAWGFAYKTIAFTWIKTNRKAGTLFWGLGHYTRPGSEICLLGIRGKGPPRVHKNVHQVVISPMLRHSQKPAEVRNRIVQLFGDLPRIELFARDHPPGWDVWGNEVPQDHLLL